MCVCVHVCTCVSVCVCSQPRAERKKCFERKSVSLGKTLYKFWWNSKEKRRSGVMVAKLQRRHFEGLFWRILTFGEATVNCGVRERRTEKRQGHQGKLDSLCCLFPWGILENPM